MCHMWKTAGHKQWSSSPVTHSPALFTHYTFKELLPLLIFHLFQKLRSRNPNQVSFFHWSAVHRPRKPVYSDIKELDLASLNSPSQPSVSLILRFFCQIAFSVAECTATKKMHISYGLSSESKQLGAGFRDYVGRQTWHPCPLNQPPVTLWGPASVLTV